MSELVKMTPAIIAATAKEAIASKLYGKFRTIEEASIAIRKGADIGLSPMQSLEDFSVVNGRPSLGADAMVALVRSTGKCRYWIVTASSATAVTIQTARMDEPETIVHSHTYTKQTATTAGLWGKTGPWTQHPETMLEHACARILARRVYPEKLRGIYTPEEARNIPRDEQPNEQVTVITQPATETFLDNEKAIDEIKAQMNSAQSKEELVMCATSLKALTLTLDERAACMSVYSENTQRISMLSEVLTPDAWRNRMAASKNQYECAGAFRKRVARFRSLGVLSEYADVFVARMTALGVEENDAKAKAIEIMHGDVVAITVAEAVAETSAAQ